MDYTHSSFWNCNRDEIAFHEYTLKLEKTPSIKSTFSEFPSPSVIIDMNYYPSKLSSSDNHIDIWKSILSPLIFQDSSKTDECQKMITLHGNIKELSAKFMNHESDVATNKELRRINASSEIFAQYSPPSEIQTIQFDKETVAEIITDIDHFLAVIDYDFRKLDFSPHYFALSDCLLKIFLEHPNEDNLLFVLRWGLVSHDLRVIMQCIQALILSKTRHNIKINPTWSDFTEINSLIWQYPNINSIMFYSNKFPSKVLNKAYHGQHIICTETDIYLFEPEPIMFSKSKSPKTIHSPYHSLRHFSSCPIALSKGYLVIDFYGSIIAYSLSENIRLPTTIINKSDEAQLPPKGFHRSMTSDGYYFYNLYFSPQLTIGIFSFSNPNIIYHRSVRLQGPPLNFDDVDGHAAHLVSNGVTLSFLFF